MINDDQIKQLHSKQTEIIVARRERQAAARKTYVEQLYPNLPKPTLESLQMLITILEKSLIANPTNVDLQSKIENLRNKILTEDYAKPGSVEMDYHNQYHEYVRSFVWPTQEEKDIQQAENMMLEDLKNSFSV